MTTDRARSALVDDMALEMRACPLGAVLVITDYASRVRQMLSFAKLIDVPGGSDGVYTLPVLHADATKLAEKINAILNLGAGGAAPPRPAAPDALRAETAAAPSKLIGGVIGKMLVGSSLFGQSIPSFAVLFNAVADQSDANIISAPSIIPVDNGEAKYKVGKKIPVKKTQFTGLGGGTTPPGALQTSSDLTDFPLTLNIKPHISNDDMVLLEVKHEADELTDEVGPTSSTRSLETRVVVHDQETIVLGGLTQEKEIHDATKVPLLGDIPLLGYLFKDHEDHEAQDQPAHPPDPVHHQGPARSPDDPRAQDARA